LRQLPLGQRALPLGVGVGIVVELVVIGLEAERRQRLRAGGDRFVEGAVEEFEQPPVLGAPADRIGCRRRGGCGGAQAVAASKRAAKERLVFKGFFPG
jgi:hypothetical protein